jgi:hypothetical protein
MFKAQMQAVVQCGMENMISEAVAQAVDTLAEKYRFNAAGAKEYLGVVTLAQNEPQEQAAAASAAQRMPPPGRPLSKRSLLRDTSTVLAGKKHIAKDENRRERLEQWRQLFDHIDTDKSGALSREELDVALTAAHWTPADVGKLFGVLDSNRDGAVDREEWSKGLEKYSSLAHGGASAAALLRVWEAGKLSGPLVRKKSGTVLVAGPEACGPQVRVVISETQ